MKEPSILDYLKGKFMPWKYPRVELPDLKPEEEKTKPLPVNPEPTSGLQPNMSQVEMGEGGSARSEGQIHENLAPVIAVSEKIEFDDRLPAEPILDSPVTIEEDKPGKPGIRLPWAALASLILALIAQNSFEPSPERSWIPGLIFYLMALACLGLAIYRQEWQIAPIPQVEADSSSIKVRIPELIIGLILALLAFLTSSGNRFSVVNIVLLITAISLLMRAFWVKPTSTPTMKERIRSWIDWKEWQIKLTPWRLLWLITIVLVVIFRFYQLNSTPAEMNSDHAEKILDISRLLAGQTNIFFPNNGGREALQMYLVAGLNRFLGIPLGFSALKFSSALVGFLALFFIFLIGKEIASRRVGWLAFVFAGIAYWTNIVSRLGLRLPFYILFTAVILYLLIRGLKKANSNELLWCGVALGLSFYGYTADRILPFLVLAIIGIYLIHPASKGYRKKVLLGTLGLYLIAFIIFLPMLRYSFEYPGSFLFRTFSRLGSVERPLPGSAGMIFLNNLGRAMAMPSWSDGEIWTISIPYRPALEVVTGALYWIGLVLVIYRLIRQRHWLDFSLLVAIPILLLPSVMSLAFPAENPNLYRTGGVVVIVFLLIALALDGLITSLEKSVQGKPGRIFSIAVMLLLLFWSAWQSFHLIFRQYDQQYRLSSWNSSEMAKVMQDFSETFGNTESTYLVGYPHWVDSRLIAIQAGQIDRDPGILPERLIETLSSPYPKLFIINPLDDQSIQQLTSYYPNGWMNTIQSQTPTKDFNIFFVPPTP
jgi:hypothetical protein